MKLKALYEKQNMTCGLVDISLFDRLNESVFTVLNYLRHFIFKKLFTILFY